MMSFRYIGNPVVAYFDVGDPVVRRFRRIRKNFRSLTEIRQIKRSDMWTFRISTNISRIFADPQYPLHYPNTVSAQYACVSSSKFELVKEVINDNPFNSNYIAWLDIGYFRRRLKEPITLRLPSDFKRNKVAFTEVRRRDETLTAADIIRHNVNWLAAGYFVAHYKIMDRFVSGYLDNLRYFLERGIMSAEQQMIYAMVNTNGTREKLPEIQAYSSTNTANGSACSKWFYLGCLCTHIEHI